MAEAKEIQYVEVAGRQIAAVHVICPECNVLDFNTVFDTNKEPWKAFCTKGHSWEIPREN